jgi:hypothetical protein
LPKGYFFVTPESKPSRDRREAPPQFIGFLDPDGNQLYLAELSWTHVEQGEGKYQHA